MRLRITYANVTSTLALFFAMGGASYAAANLPPDSVGTAQLKPHSVGTTQLKDRSVGSTQLMNGAVGSTQLKNGAVGSDQLQAASVRVDKLAADSVGSAQIQPNAVTSYQIAPGAVGAREVEQGSLLYSDFSTDEVSPRVFGEFDGAGVLGANSGVAAVHHLSVGNYLVDFYAEMTGCVAVASATYAAPQTHIPAVLVSTDVVGEDLSVWVTSVSTGALVDAAISFVLDC